MATLEISSWAYISEKAQAGDWARMIGKVSSEGLDLCNGLGVQAKENQAQSDQEDAVVTKAAMGNLSRGHMRQRISLLMGLCLFSPRTCPSAHKHCTREGNPLYEVGSVSLRTINPKAHSFSIWLLPFHDIWSLSMNQPVHLISIPHVRAETMMALGIKNTAAKGARYDKVQLALQEKRKPDSYCTLNIIWRASQPNHNFFYFS